MSDGGTESRAGEQDKHQAYVDKLIALVQVCHVGDWWGPPRNQLVGGQSEPSHHDSEQAGVGFFSRFSGSFVALALLPSSTSSSGCVSKFVSHPLHTTSRVSTRDFS